jgi:isoleucyl-tRNA synthetase
MLVCTAINAVAQSHFPVEKEGYFEDQIPADFYLRRIDQTRGGSYSLLAIGPISPKISLTKARCRQ